MEQALGLGCGKGDAACIQLLHGARHNQRITGGFRSAQCGKVISGRPCLVVPDSIEAAAQVMSVCRGQALGLAAANTVFVPAFCIYRNLSNKKEEGMDKREHDCPHWWLGMRRKICCMRRSIL